MQDFLKQFGFLLLSLFVLLIMRQAKIEMQIPIRLIIIVVLFGVCISAMEGVILEISALGADSGASKYAEIMMKSLFIGIITTIGSSICSDAGEGTLSFICTLIGKAQLLALAMPLVIEILNMALKLVGGGEI